MDSIDNHIEYSLLRVVMQMSFIFASADSSIPHNYFWFLSECPFLPKNVTKSILFYRNFRKKGKALT